MTIKVNHMDKLKDMATALAASIPPHLGKPTIPPIAWAQEGEILHVVLADGRKVSANIQAINELMFAQDVKGAVRIIPAGTYPEKDQVVIPPLKAAAQPASPATKRTIPSRGGKKK